MTTGIGVPFSLFLGCALNALQNSMMLGPRWRGAAQIGGGGFAAPAGTCNFRKPVTFFAMSHSLRRKQAAPGSWCGPERLAGAQESFHNDRAISARLNGMAFEKGPPVSRRARRKNLRARALI